jgi:hypothetical protein
MRLLRNLFPVFSAPRPRYPVTVQLNAKIKPLDRGRLFQEPLRKALESKGLGTSHDGGTLTSREGEIVYCDVEVDLYENSERAYLFVKDTVERLGAPKGSKLRVSRDDIRPIGVAEGLAIYLNGTALPDEVYASCDSNFVYDEIDRLVAGEGRIANTWQGPSETALYLYGSSFDELNRRIADFVATYPLCQNCRIVQIA